MCPSSNIITKLTRSNDIELDISQSNEKSKIIKVVSEINEDSKKERFYDTLLEDYDILKLITNHLLDMGKTDQSILYIFSSKLEKDDGIESRQEYSTQCKYNLDPNISNLDINILNIQQTAGKLEEVVIKGLFQLGDMYGRAINDLITDGFSNRERLKNYSEIKEVNDYESVISTCLRIGVFSVFEHICWCSKCTEKPYAILILGQNNIHDEIRCPICETPLFSAKFITMLPEFGPLLENDGGFLPPLIGWYLTKEEFEWTANVTMNKQEYADILFKRENQYYLIESKMWSRAKNERGLTGSIKKAIDQAVKHANYWENKNIKIKKIAIITNQFDNSIFQGCVDESLKEKTKDIGGKTLKIYPLKRISKFITELIGE